MKNQFNRIIALCLYYYVCIISFLIWWCRFWNIFTNL